MTTETRLLTAEDLWNISDNGMRHELVDGELRTMAPAGGEHGGIVMHFGGRLATFVEDHDLGVMMSSETGFVIAGEPETVRCPDFAFVAKSRIPQEGIPKGFWKIVPDLACEVVSPSDTLFDVEEKVQQYLQSGVRLVWLINPKQRTVTVYRPGPIVRVLTIRDSIEGEEVIPGFSYRVQKVFAR